MEKPFFAHQISPRYLVHTDIKTAHTQRFDDRLTLRGITSRPKTDEESNDKPAWRGDHTFSSDAATYSLKNFIEPEVAIEHPEWGQEKVHTEAMQRFEQRLKQDLLYERKEAEHIESSVRWKPVETKEGVWELATEYGDRLVTLNELWEHTKEYASFVGNPEAYNVSEHRAQLIMQQEFVKGTQTGFVSVLSHPDSIRYIQIWEKGTDGDVVSKQVDLYKATGRDLSHEEGRTLIDHISRAYSDGKTITSTEQSIEYAHFFVEKGSIQEQDIRLIARAHILYTDIPVSGVVTAHQVINREATDRGVQLFDNRPQFIQSLRQAIDKKIESLETIRKMGFPSAGEHIAFFSVNKKKEKPKQNNISSETQVIDVLPPVKEMHPDSESMISSLLSEWIISRNFIRHAEYVPVASQAALYWFSVVAETRGTGLKDKRKDKASKKVFLRSERRLPNKMRKLFPSIFRTERSGSRRASEKKPRTPIKENNILERIVRTPTRETRRYAAAIRSIFRALGIQPEASVQTINRKESVSPVFVLRLLGVVDAVAQLLAVKPISSENMSGNPLGQHMVTPEMQPINIQEIVPLVGNVAFAWILWLLVSPQQGLREHNGSFSDSRAAHTHEMLDQAGSPPWVLLAIIWHLVMIRESGLTGQYVPPTVAAMKNTSAAKKQRKGNIFAAPFPVSGVIFTFAS